MKVAVAGATGLVGSRMLQVLEERNFPVTTLIPVASEQSVGSRVNFRGREWPVVSMSTAVEQEPHLALFSAGGSVSIEWAPRFAARGTRVVDNSSAWRMDPAKKLVVPEVNGHVIGPDDMIIANPNCSTIQMVMVLKPLHDRYGVTRVVVSTYQSVTGTGKKAVDQLMNERKGVQGEMAYRYTIDLNALPQIDVFMDNGYTREEMKMANETCKIMGDEAIRVTATCVRIPVMGGHSESCNIEFARTPVLEEVRALLAGFPGVCVLDNPGELVYPTPRVHAADHDEVYVGRIRMDETRPNAINCWIVSDNLRKGAATNAVQIAELLVAKGLLKAG
jgi:aspartate-semialdehyde dehydrogenase